MSAGYLTPDNVMEVLGGVELTPELISAVVGSVAAEGIEWRDHDEPISDEGLDRLAAELIREPRRNGRDSPLAPARGPSAPKAGRGRLSRSTPGLASADGSSRQ